MGDNQFCIEYAARGTAGCKKCKQKIPKGEIRIAKLTANPFNDDPDAVLKNWHHVDCMFEVFSRARATTKTIEDVEDLPGWDKIESDDRPRIVKKIEENAERLEKKKLTPVKKNAPAKKAAASTVPSTSASASASSLAVQPERAATSGGISDKDAYVTSTDKTLRDNSFRAFRVLVANVADTAGYLDKTNLIRNYITKGNDGESFKGDVYLVMSLLLPGVVKQIYNLNNKQIVKLFSRIFDQKEEEMVEDLNKGDVAETVRIFFEASSKLPPTKKSNLSLQCIYDSLRELAKETKEDDQQRVLEKFAKRCTGNDLKMVVRLIKHDLRMQSGAKHVLEALDENAYEAFQASRNLRDVVERVKEGNLKITASIMTPVLPMLCDACRSVNQAFKKCPNGMYSEIKYDGERVQVHKNGSEFKYFSRSLKPVLPHKVNLFKEFLPRAFPKADSLILDSEVLLIDTKTSKPLPFGTLGKHKQSAFTDANVCLFIFDCLHFNGKSLMDLPIRKRRKFLSENMTEIPNRILFSEMKHVTKEDDLKGMIAKVLTEGLEGLVLKDVESIYEPGKRHWLKVKKDYLLGGTMADTADLVVLGAYFGEGQKGGMMSIFLMGCWDETRRKFCTVTKCHSGFDDAAMLRLQKELKMIKIDKDKSKLPDWLNINTANVNIIPEFIAEDPFQSPVWEIKGAEFTRAELHTADGISIRFPRVTKERRDKSWKEATSLPQLKDLFRKSKEETDFHALLGVDKSALQSSSPPRDADAMEEGDDEDRQPTPPPKRVTPPPKRSLTTTASAASTPSPTSKFVFQKRQTKPSPAKIPKYDQEDDEKPSGDVASTAVVGDSAASSSTTVKKDKGKSLPNGHSSTKNGSQSTTAFDKSVNATLCDIFVDVKIFIPLEESHEGLLRYFVAFGGEVLEGHERNAATHVLVDVAPEDDGGRDVKRVTSDWIWHSIRKRSLLDAEAYIV